MAQRPDSSRGDGVAGRCSTGNSAGVASVALSHRSDPSFIAGDVAEDMTASIVDGVLGSQLPPIPAGPETIGTDARDDVDGLRAQNSQLQDELKNTRSELDFAQSVTDGLHKKQGALEEHLRQAQSELQHARAQLARHASEGQSLPQGTQSLDMDLMASNDGKDAPSTQATVDLAGEGSEDPPLLAAAYQQISVLNTQLSHLYAELTMARIEVQHLRSVQESDAQQEQHADSTLLSNGEADAQKQSQQIADLVGDIRHLQLDLEYHQQKLDHMIEEKQLMMKDLKQCRSELAEAQQLAEEREQMLRHRDVDLQHLKQELKSPRPGADNDTGMINALRTEAAAKDSALIVSHYELHKEKLLRDRLEQKNAKLMERMQKLMMVVETMRRENISLEKLVSAKDRANDAKEVQLRQVTAKAKQLQKTHRAMKIKPKAPLELQQAAQQGLPPLDRQPGGGRQSGMSTPRTPQCPPSPYDFK
jgi:DNA repair exonuclease SbcCD ATPase subunit